MIKRQPTPAQGTKLRREAVERLEERDAGRPRATSKDPIALLHELEVHQIELEMQNEELKNARRGVEIALRRYTELFDFAPIGYIVLDRDGVVLALNFAAARLLGAERRRVVGAKVGSFVSEADRDLFTSFLSRVLLLLDTTEPTPTCEIALLEGHAEPRDVRMTGACLEDETQATLISIEDITARKRAEAALREESRHKGEFLTVLSHELRNPLVPVRNSLFLLEQEGVDEETARTAREVIRRQVDHLVRLVDDLLDVTRIELGKVQLQREALDLGALVRSALDDHRSSFESKGIELKARIGSEPFWVQADVTRLSQVLGNLLGNAAKFTPRGGEVEVSLQREGPMAALSVRDTGIGIAPDIRHRLFEPFVQGTQSLDRAYGGLGLGLAMVKGLVELHGGSIDVASDGLGRGTEFTIRLKLGGAARARSAPAERPRMKRCCVLVIDDNEDVAQSLRMVLETLGHRVYLAHDGPSGIACAKDFRPDVILCDIGLPGMNGYEVAQAIRADNALTGMYLIALTGYALPEDIRQARMAGFDTHLPKPPDVPAIEQALAESRRGAGDDPFAGARP